ncbi:MAG: arginine--tRNA ligase [Sphaerochaetaceae bacterium]|nr:arginine--tRNA ligase [Sphaerochaetaceae bacterium]
MIDRQQWKDLVQARLSVLLEKSGREGVLNPVVVQVPPKPEMGDLAFPLFAYAKVFGKSPVALAEELTADINSLTDRPEGQAFAAGPYMNVRVDMESLIEKLCEKVEKEKDSYGCTDALDGRKVMIEFSCPNTNKPLHLGHVRNDCLGNSVSTILKASGANVMKVNLINNRGVHICKSMLAYKKFGNGETPESTGIKGDHFVGSWYVRFNAWAKEDPTAEDQAQEMLVKWEQGDPETIELWKLMNKWTIDGITETYRNTGISFDRYYYESDTYKLGKDKVLEGLERGIFQKQEDGAIYIDNSDIGLDKKILLRKDGTSIYITQDIGTAINRHEDWPFDSLVYVVASEQKYHFKVLFHVLDKLGMPWAKDLHHLSYGMVFLPEGKMKSREGTVVDADDLLLQLTTMAREEITEKGRDKDLEDPDRTAHDIALGALNYYMLQFDPVKDVTFNPKESLSFNGNTGPYIQYMGARISSILRNFSSDSSSYEGVKFNPALLVNEDERQMFKLCGSLPELVNKAASTYDPSVICAFLYELCKTFSHWYHDNQVLNPQQAELSVSRIELCKVVLTSLKNAMALIGIPFLEKM